MRTTPLVWLRGAAVTGVATLVIGIAASPTMAAPDTGRGSAPTSSYRWFVEDLPGVAPDVDGDGQPDLVTVRDDGSLWFWPGAGTPGNPALGTATHLGWGWEDVDRIVTLDADGDGRLDILGRWRDGRLSAYLNESSPGSPGFTGSGFDLGSGWDGLNNLHTLDYDGDGRDDIVGHAEDGTLWGTRNLGTPGHPDLGDRERVGWELPDIDGTLVADADADGRDDLVSWRPGHLWVQLNKGSGEPDLRSVELPLTWGPVDTVIAVDQDGDGRTDLVGRRTDGDLYVFLNTGTPDNPAYTWPATQIGWGGWSEIDRFTVADIDSDGHDDLVGWWWHGALTAYLGAGIPGEPRFSGQRDFGWGWDNVTQVAVIA